MRTLEKLNRVKGNCIACCFIVVLLGAVTVSCDRLSAGHKQEALNAVKYYNSRMQRAYMEGNVELMVGAATENQIKKLVPVIEMLQATDNRMMTDQKTFIVKRIVMGGERLHIETEETWVYWWQQKDSGAITKPEETITYKLRYNLVREGDVWSVDNIENIE